MLATGGSAIMAIQKIIEKGVNQKNITFLNLISHQGGIDNVHSIYPNVKIITAVVDPIINENKYILPGLGDFGDRYFASTRKRSSSEQKSINKTESSEEIIVVVDENNKIIGKKPRKIVKRDKLWHRASYVYIYSSEKKAFVVQKRSRSKSYNPGFYDLSTGGYLNIDDLDDENDLTNAKREVTEELGIQF